MFKPSIPPFAMLLPIGAAQALFLLFLVIWHRRTIQAPNRRYATLLLIGLLSTLALILIDQFLVSTHYFVLVPHLTFIPIPLLLGPLMLGLILAECKPNSFKFKWSHLAHLLPFVIVLCALIPLYRLPAEQKLILYLQDSAEIQLKPEGVISLIAAYIFVATITFPYEELSLLVYFAAGATHLWLHRSALGNPQLTMIGMDRGVLLTIFGIFGLQISLFAGQSSLETVFGVGDSVFLTILLSSVALLIFAGSFASVRFFSQTNTVALIPNPTPRAKYQNSGLSPDQAQTIGQQLIQLMEQEHLYLNADLKLSDLASAVGYTSNIVSQVLNTELGKSYSGFVNQYRINFAKKRLQEPDSDALIVTIAHDAGFNSKATFNGVFKKMVGMTPSVYRKSQLNR